MPRIALPAAHPDASTAPASTFLRGLTMGALVGAAIAGTLLFGRRSRTHERLEAERPGAEAPHASRERQERR